MPIFSAGSNNRKRMACSTLHNPSNHCKYIKRWPLAEHTSFVILSIAMGRPCGLSLSDTNIHIAFYAPCRTHNKCTEYVSHRARTNYGNWTIIIAVRSVNNDTWCYIVSVAFHAIVSAKKEVGERRLYLENRSYIYIQINVLDSCIDYVI